MPTSSDRRARAWSAIVTRVSGIAAVGLLVVGFWVTPLIEARGNSSDHPAPDNGGPGPFDAAELKDRLSAKGVALGTPIMIRIFKQEAELELWVDKGARFERFAAYSICNWSGVLGPKLSEGDKQSPEGLYSIGVDQLRRRGRWRRSLDIGYPNTFDKALGRTGSFILVHGGCTSVGCFAMTNPVIEEIFALSEAALAKGQERIPVHVFPFRMTQANMDAHADSPWNGFWSNLKEAYDAFERTSIPPQVSVCANRYVRYVVGQASDPSACVVNVSEPSVAVARPRYARYARFARRRRVASRRGARSARRAYAAARRARMAAIARRQAAYVGGPRGSQR
jgi:murein L,D-transpeptidase YafK